VDRLGKFIVGIYLGVLVGLGVHSLEATAQGESPIHPAGETVMLQPAPPPAPTASSSQIAIATPMGPTVLDMGNLTVPGALVIVAWMFLRHLKEGGGWKPTITVEARIVTTEAEDTGGFRLMRVEHTDPGGG